MAINKLILAFVTLILGIVLLIQTANTTNTVSDLNTQTDILDISPARLAGGQMNMSYNFTLSKNPTDWRSSESDCNIKSITLLNGSNTELTDGTHYVFRTSDNTVSLVNGIGQPYLNSSLTSNNTFAVYEYCGEDYLASSWGRTAITLIPGLFAIALVIISVMLFYSIGKESGIIN